VGGVLTAVEFHDEVLFQANEIDDVGSDGALSAELLAGEGAVSKARPQQGFGVG